MSLVLKTMQNAVVLAVCLSVSVHSAPKTAITPWTAGVSVATIGGAFAGHCAAHGKFKTASGIAAAAGGALVTACAKGYISKTEAVSGLFIGVTVATGAYKICKRLKASKERKKGWLLQRKIDQKEIDNKQNESSLFVNKNADIDSPNDAGNALKHDQRSQNNHNETMQSQGSQTALQQPQAMTINDSSEEKRDDSLSDNDKQKKIEAASPLPVKYSITLPKSLENFENLRPVHCFYITNRQNKLFKLKNFEITWADNMLEKSGRKETFQKTIHEIIEVWHYEHTGSEKKVPNLNNICIHLLQDLQLDRWILTTDGKSRWGNKAIEYISQLTGTLDLCSAIGGNQADAQEPAIKELLDSHSDNVQVIWQRFSKCFLSKQPNYEEFRGKFRRTLKGFQQHTAYKDLYKACGSQAKFEKAYLQSEIEGTFPNAQVLELVHEAIKSMHAQFNVGVTLDIPDIDKIEIRVWRE